MTHSFTTRRAAYLRGVEQARWLWWLALAGGISFFCAVFHRLDRPPVWAWKATGVGFLALWAAANARERDGWLIAAALGFGALGDWLLDAKGLETGAVAFVVGQDRKSTRLNSSH